MQKKVILTPMQSKRIDRAIKEHNALKKTREVLKGYKGKSFKILKIKQLVENKLK